MSACIDTSALAEFDRDANVRNRLIHLVSVGHNHAARQPIDPVPELARRACAALRRPCSALRCP
ncbi:MAG: hypothetical protein ACUVT2_09405 [Thiobacillaceae bacterium]